jgi:arginine exporter protein ArgO
MGLAIGYWISIGGTLVAAGVAGTSASQTAAFLAGYVGATLVWCFVMALVVRWGQSFLKPAVFRWVTFACSAALLVFGVSLGWQMFQPLLS